MSPTPKPTLILIHGAWHGSWCWEFQTPALTALDYASIETVDLPSTRGERDRTQFDDAAHVRSVIKSHLAAGKRVVILAHSYAGPIASAALAGLSNHSDSVLGLICLATFIFPGGMDQGAVIREIGGLPYAVWDTPSPGLFITNDPRALFYSPDTPEERVEWAVSKLTPQSMAANLGIVPPQAWQDEGYRGRFAYIGCTDDVVIPVAQQDGMLAAAGGKEKWLVRTLEGSGHSPFLSRPEEVAAVVDEIVNEFDAGDR